MKNQTLQLDRQQAETLTELGARLAQARQERGITLEQISAETRIPVRQLQAIEQGNLQHLPEPVYIQGFLRRYADAIGLDGQLFAYAFPAELGAQNRRSSWRSLPAAQLRPVHLYLIYMVLIIGAVSGLSSLLNRSTSGQPQLAGNLSTQPDAIQLRDRAPLGPPLPSAAPTASAQLSLVSDPTLAGKPVRVGLKLTAQSWIRVVADGKTEFEGVLSEGTQRTWVADRQLVLRAGNAGAVLVSFNDGQTRQLGEAGSVEEVSFPADPRFARLPNSLVSAPPSLPNRMF